MAIKIGIVGLGFMGKMHFESYQKIKGAKVVAFCDVDAKKRDGDWSTIGGNIAGSGKKVDLTGVNTYSKLSKMLEDEELDIVDITLPTNQHLDATLEALKSGRHVICEKPMARTSAEGKKMVQMATKMKRKLFIGHCMRYWPEYEAARDVVHSGKYGKVLSATFKRLSLTPTWSWKNWLMDFKKSGGAALDLHIHDTDFIYHCFGKPKSVNSTASGFKKGRLDHITTSYNYPGNTTIVAEGGWDLPAGFGFNMSFNINMEKAMLQWDGVSDMMLHPIKGKSKKVKVKSGDGYINELKDFVDAVKNNRAAKYITPEAALNNVKLLEAEMKSALTDKRVLLK